MSVAGRGYESDEASERALHPVDARDERRWDDLALSCGSSPFVRPGWLRAWMAAFGGTRTLQVLTMERGGELTGVLPLLAGWWTLRSPTNSETPIFSPIVADTENAAQLADRLLSARPGAVDLDALPGGEGTASAALLRAAERRGVAVLRRTLRYSPYLDVSGELADFTRGLSKNRRHGLKRLRNRLRDAGKLTFDVHDGREDLDSLLRDGFRLEAREWKRAAGSAILSRPATTQFYTSAARWAAEVGILRLAFLRLDGRPIAFGYCVQQGSCLYYLKVGMDDAYVKLGPGMVFTHHLIEHAFAQPDVTQLDFLGENDAYKADFTSGTSEQLRLQIFPSAVFGRLHRGAMASAADLRSSLVSRLPEPTRARLSAMRNRLTR